MPDPAGVQALIAHFNRCFSRWDIQLALKDAKARQGKICKKGWAIWYLFGQDEKGEYLDYYSSHRMTDDEHVRVYEDGSSESLPAIRTAFISPPDPEEQARSLKEYLEYNQSTAALLEEKGFGIAGDEPMSIQVNRYLRCRDPSEK